MESENGFSGVLLIVDIRVTFYNHQKLNVAVYQQFLQISTGYF